jgi:acyl carrier protein
MITHTDAINWIAGVFEQSPEDLSPETPMEQVPMWDSLGVLTLMAEFDQKFGIVLDDSDMREIKRVDDILEILRKQGKLEPVLS